jgi:hypothetical protein
VLLRFTLSSLICERLDMPQTIKNLTSRLKILVLQAPGSREAFG